MDWDQYGHCVQCHKNLIIEAAIDGRVQQRWSVDADETQFLLSDGSRMRVCICKDCKGKLTEADNSKIMKCVLKGWEREIDIMVLDPKKPEWDKQSKEKYMANYSRKEIITNSEDIKDPELEVHIKKYENDKKVKK